ncbi:non-ribosomal peptide synthetase [Amycolatopsis sp. FDAARGOS 1241]|uniref:non-ribosomal peptide synthetase n=1 Tax=Amycolatopsis sp. FDAARGOS 1241 TaxID=2778070 RepID=UPI00194EC478|nr:non-ribosomal peptide synthetase [Amycolatopsis sp. FDAARGOS 1241]QRP47069.1 non-ribosomal peptide synthetase [Amycolatopsis sp. FDAARGOS 1241]
MSGERCHALAVRVAESVTRPGLWVTDVPAAADDPPARRRRAAELNRPAAASRAVLLRYTDGAELVLVARRDVDDLAGFGLAARPDTPVAVSAEVPEWGLGDPRANGAATTFLAAEAGTERSWLAALAITLARYGTADPAVATDRGAVEFPPAETIGELRPSTVDRPVSAGLYHGGPGEGEYVPCLAPPFPLTVSVLPGPGGVRLRCDHLLRFVAPEIAAGFLRHLRHVHTQVLTAPEKRVEDVELLDAGERARVAALGRPDAELVTVPATLPEAFARVVAARPDEVALCDGDLRLTYRELDERATALAAGLRARGVRERERVGVCLERSAELVVALLGVLKAGATYVPLDPAYPAERLAHTAADAGLRVAVTRSPGLPVEIRVTPDEPGAGGPVTTTITPDDPAYVIYTSGSTGRPKGVVVPHRNVLALLDATRAEYGLGPGEVWTWFHSSAFDFSVWEIWGCLVTGGRLVVVPYFVSRDPGEFRDLLRAERVTVLSQTPSAFAQLLSVAHDDLAVRLVVFGGEPLDARMLLPWFDRHPEPSCRLVNMFGITETTVHVTATTLTRADALAASRSVGPPLPGWSVAVLDPAGRPVPPGVAGEIVVGGAGVASHYLNQEELTAQRFRAGPDGRVYHSGDLGRLRPDGELEHLGRIDSQVKMRGFRIELDEIRSVLLEDPHVRAAAVVVRRADPADAASARLDAYVTLEPGGAPAEVRRRAMRFLPEYMVPATITPLPTLPLTTNGKLDAAKLPAPAVPTAAPPEPAAGGDLSATLRTVWSTVLGVPVGLDDDFFELGGNSLFAVRINAALDERGLPSVRLRELYRRPTIRAVVAGMAGAPGQPAAGVSGSRPA